MKVSIKVVFILIILFNFINTKTFPQTQRNPVLEFCTGTWCQWCPCGHLVVDNILATLPNAIILGYHGPPNSGNDPFSFFPGNSIISSFGFTGYPTAVIDRVSGIQSRGSWASWMSSRNLEPAEVSIDIDAIFEPTTREFSATIDFTALTDLSGQFKFNVILSEDGIVWSQTGNSSCPGDPNYVHKHLVRDMMNGALGEEVINGFWNNNQIITKTINYVIPVPAGPVPDMVWDSCNVVVMIYKVGAPLANNAEIQQAMEYPLPYINVPYLGVISPNGGESWAGGSNQSISWTGNLVSDVKIEYSTDGGMNWITIIDSITNTENYDWNIPYTVSNDCKIKVCDATNSAMSDESDNTFTIFLMEFMVNEGWNMITVPLHQSSMAVSDLFPNAISPAFGYNEGYYSADTLKNGIGYWIKFDSTEVIYNGGNQADSNVVLVNNGWNMIGPFHEGVNLASIITIPDNLFISAFYGYMNGYYTTTAFNIGEGYWVKTWSDGLVIMNSGSLLKDEEIEKASVIPKEWGEISFTDATGKIFTLYAVKGEVNLDNYELPPIPPAGLYDIRFSSGRLAEDINSSMQSIDITGVTYPLTVKVEGMDIRLQDATGSAVNVSLKSGEDVVISDATIQKLMVTGELVPAVYALEQNYPNPFNPSTMIEFSLPEDVSNAKLSIYNALGEKIAELVNSGLTAGKYQFQWNAKNVATGMYIYELRTDKFVAVKKMLLMK